MIISKHSEKEEMSGVPAPWGALYAPPNEDGSRKKCENCFMWVKNEKKCVILDKKLTINPTDVCGYHVYGKPFENWIDSVKYPIPEELAGLSKTEDGTSCDICKYYGNKKCYAVATEDNGDIPATIDPKGCCARWAKKE